MTTSVDRPVTSSTCFATVTPSSTFSNFTRPAYSVMIGREVASHIASTLPALTCSPSLTSSVAPYGTLWRSRSRPLSSWISTSPERAMTTSSPLRVGDVAHHRREAHDAGRLAFELRCRRGTRRRAADVERPHRELRARLADRLRGDDADRFADVDQVPAAQIAAVAGRAQAVARVAGERRAHLDFVDAERLDLLDLVFVQQRAGVDTASPAFPD